MRARERSNVCSIGQRVVDDLDSAKKRLELRELRIVQSPELGWWRVQVRTKKIAHLDAFRREVDVFYATVFLGRTSNDEALLFETIDEARHI